MRVSKINVVYIVIVFLSMILLMLLLSSKLKRNLIATLKLTVGRCSQSCRHLVVGSGFAQPTTCVITWPTMSVKHWRLQPCQQFFLIF
jgi:hypothetical protein